ncbi:MAG: hypothetical protein GX256_08645 [Fretibacterium sp.]|nr:hypothetical protein [Fretibacterium sp.]
MAGALPSEEYKTRLEKAGFGAVNVTLTKPHDLNMEVVRTTVEGLTPEELDSLEGLSFSALITALKPQGDTPRS